MKIVTSHFPFPSQPGQLVVSAPSSESLSTSLVSRLTQLRQTLKQWLFVGKEPQITQTMGRDGQVWWRVYDPVSEQLQWLETEEEVLCWLDSLRYR